MSLNPKESLSNNTQQQAIDTVNQPAQTWMKPQQYQDFEQKLNDIAEGFYTEDYPSNPTIDVTAKQA